MVLQETMIQKRIPNSPILCEVGVDYISLLMNIVIAVLLWAAENDTQNLDIRFNR